MKTRPFISLSVYGVTLSLWMFIKMNAQTPEVMFQSHFFSKDLESVISSVICSFFSGVSYSNIKKLVKILRYAPCRRAYHIFANTV